MKEGCGLGVRLLDHLQRVGKPPENIRGVDVRNAQRDSENRTEEPEDWVTPDRKEAKELLL